ncbi:Cytidylyltransferase [Carpediemonas membranifera]|uniref:ethanolamine-phosphate cytidylyltransferase n=1 Tax=Carpediemonas membranifera TaxID=201153 RepID=A0A8J6E934_9EUKA|nr:Cytidylyltransferase [Carpediemonas membranifera]|eukprot:KAG9392755.1 Cytidylyltransferase [Carpediemonas membranifera]
MSEKKEVRVFIDGCFDLVHFGHANAMRQAKGKGSWLCVGVHTDADIIANKGPPIMTEEERYEAVRAVKWVDQVHEASPYVTYIETLDKLNCDFVCHGEDITLSADGNDCYSIAQREGRFQFIHRTEGVSTSDIANRIMARLGLDIGDAVSASTGSDRFLPSARKIALFSDMTEPTDETIVVWVDGSFDLLHPGHLAWLKTIKETIPGAYIIAGVHSDAVVEQYTGEAPYMTMHERGLGLLACRYVDDVVFDSPLELSPALLDEYKVKTVAIGPSGDKYKIDGYSEARQRGIMRTIAGPRDMDMYTVINRIRQNQEVYIAKNRAKAAKEAGKA